MWSAPRPRYTGEGAQTSFIVFFVFFSLTKVDLFYSFFCVLGCFFFLAIFEILQERVFFWLLQTPDFGPYFPLRTKILSVSHFLVNKFQLLCTNPEARDLPSDTEEHKKNNKKHKWAQKAQLHVGSFRTSLGCTFSAGEDLKSTRPERSFILHKTMHPSKRGMHSLSRWLLYSCIHACLQGDWRSSLVLRCASLLLWFRPISPIWLPQFSLIN